MSESIDGTGPGAPHPTDELGRLRGRIDELDRTIVRLLNERAGLAIEAGRLKASAGRPEARDAEREREVLLRVAMANQGPLPQADLVDLYRRLIDALVALEERMQERLDAEDAPDPG